MSRICPETNRIVLYLECNECETKSCRNKNVNSDIKRDL